MKKLKTLTSEEARVLIHKGTEMPFTGEYWDHKADGVYLCRQCEAPLYWSRDKFDSGCGWPSFDEEIPGAVRRVKDADGRRTEIICNNCGGHLGHVFLGERFTPKNTRHCVNSLSLRFVPKEKWEQIKPEGTTTKTAIFANGCFWSKEYFFNQVEGVLSTRVGYTGGHKPEPTYKEVCSKTTGHAEAVEVTYDPKVVTYEALAKLFFEMHDPTIDRKDKGGQYRSAIFYKEEGQKKVAEKLIGQLKENDIEVVTELMAASEFWPAEARHQKYCESRGLEPTDHFTKRFD